MGRQAARLPLDPRIARMVLEADHEGCVDEVLVVAAALSVQDPRERPVDKQAQADQQHARFNDPASDFVAWLNLWRYLAEQREALSGSAFRRMCKSEYLHYLRIREWQDVHHQPAAGGARPRHHDVQLGRPRPPAPLAAVGSAVAHRPARRAHGRRQAAQPRVPRPAQHPVRDLARVGALAQAPDLVMVAEPGRDLAAVGPHRGGDRRDLGGAARRAPAAAQYSEPHWHARRGSAMARERVTLYGVPLVADRLVGYGRIDPVMAREPVRPARAGRGRLAHRPRVLPRQPRPGRRRRAAGGARAAARPAGRRRDPLRLLRRAGAGRRRLGRALRPLVEARPSRDARPADVHPADARARRRRRGRRDRLPAHGGGRRHRPRGVVPVRAGQRRRRHDRARAARRAAPAAPR
ncbi:hypothetical protein GCM10025868_33530 [Angustibacter aerolatus]|uniref:Helicase-associated domain-containing protein n=1 Tax=Angustibacter aerolatus TaxID=1162965 RepID=A0ABQ6JJE3_9ACTN|nr:hypothetical protein GCM10025868_33530 [Angustibacter aerolatus]